jgi:hypothetical protein
VPLTKTRALRRIALAASLVGAAFAAGSAFAATPPSSLWVQTANNASSNLNNFETYGNSMAPDGSVYSSLTSTGATELGSITVPFSGSGDAGGGTLAKQNPDGTWAWGRSSVDKPDFYGVAATSDNGAVVSGDGGPGQIIGGQALPQRSIFAAKFSAAGSLEWIAREQTGVGGFGMYVSAVPDGSGSSVLAGHLMGTGAGAQFGAITLPTRTANDTAYLAGISATGTFTWALQATQGTVQMYGNGVRAFADGSALLSGYMNSGTVAFGAHSITRASGGAYFARGGADGWQWATQAQYSGNSYWQGFGSQVSIAEDGAIYYTDSFAGTATFGTGAGAISVTSVGSSLDVFVAKLNPDGTWAWARRAGGTGNDRGRAVSAVNTVCGIAVVGTMSGTATFGSTQLTSTNATDVFVAEIGTDGTWNWASNYGRMNPDSGGWTGWNMAASAAQDGSIAILQGQLGTMPSTFGTLPITSGKAASGKMVRVPCAAPQNVKATAGDGKATISWDAVPGGSVTSYTVTASPGGKSCTATAPATSCVIEGLTNGTTYTFKVVAVNAAGSGPESAEAKITPTAGSQAAAEANPKITIPAAVVTRGTTLTSTVNPSVGGTVRVTATLAGRTACTVTRKATKAGRMKVTCTLNARTRATIKKKAVTLKVTARLTDAKGKTATASRNVRVPRYVVRTPVTG